MHGMLVPMDSPLSGVATEHAGPELVRVTLDKPTPAGKVVKVAHGLPHSGTQPSRLRPQAH